MKLSNEELQGIKRAALTLEEAFFLWSKCVGEELNLNLPRASEEKLNKLGFLNGSNITEAAMKFIATLDGKELPGGSRFDEFFEVFPLNESTPPIYVPTRPRPIRIQRGLAQVAYAEKLARGFSEEEMIRAARNYKNYLYRTDKEGKPYKYMRSPLNFLRDDYFTAFIETSHPSYEVLRRFRRNQNADNSHKR